ncbi:hypothetical protein HZB60_06845 [candidate division KSB1 bacterium]|nr:hypothetical protein [candidate division KSB1 bacterium]
MPKKLILLYGAPTRIRDTYELILLRAEQKVAPCSTVAEAAIHTAQSELGIVAICGLQSTHEQAELLRLVQNLPVKPPVFFLRGQSPQDERALRGDSEDAEITIDFVRELNPIVTTLMSEPPPTGATRGARNHVLINRVDYPPDYTRAHDLFDFEWLTQVLRAHRGNISRTAARIGLTRRSLQLKIRHHGISAKAIRREAEIEEAGPAE